MASTLANQGEGASVGEHMARLNMKLLHQKLEKSRLQPRSQGVDEGHGRLDPNRIRYHQSLLKRQELLDRIKATRGQEPKTGYIGDIQSSPLPIGQTNKHPMLQSAPQSPRMTLAQTDALKTNNSHPIIRSDDFEARAHTLPAQQPQAWAAPYPPYPATVPYSQYPVVAPPTVLPVATVPQQSNKSEYFDMMMLQNAQMHQLFVQQMLAQGMRPKEETQPVIIEQQSSPSLPPQPQVLTLPQKRRPRSRHHHYYTQLPPIANERSYQINHIQHIDKRKPSPVRQKTPEKKISPVPQRREDDKFLFGIRLKEAIGALHRIYLNPDGNIYPLLRDIISSGATDLTLAFNENQNVALQELVYTIENILFQMTDIMPKTGVLGTHRKAVVYEMLQEGKVYPAGYFWEIEKNGIKFDEEGKTVDIDDENARSLLIGMFLSRGMVTTLLMKPLDYGMSSTLLDETAEENLKLLASIFVYIVRKVAVPRNSRMLPVPNETARYLYSDDDLRPVLSKIQKTIDYGEEILREWMKEYIRRLRVA